MPQACGLKDLRLPTPGVLTPPLGIPALLAERSRRRSVGTVPQGAPSSASHGKGFCSHTGDPSQPAKSLDSKHVTVRPACHSDWSQEPLALGCKQYVLQAHRLTGAGNLCSAYLP